MGQSEQRPEIYQLIVDLIEQGGSVLLISSEMVKVMALKSTAWIGVSEGPGTATLDTPFSDTEILAKRAPASERGRACARGLLCAGGSIGMTQHEGSDTQTRGRSTRGLWRWWWDI